MFRKMRRSNQELERETCIDILKREPRGVLSLIGDGGYPYGIPMDFVYKDDSIYFHSAIEGHKIDAIRADPKASFCVIDKGYKPEGEWAYYFNSVIVFGRISEIEDNNKKREALRMLAGKYFPTDEDAGGEIENTLGRVACLRLDIEQVSGKQVHEK